MTFEQFVWFDGDVKSATEVVQSHRLRLELVLQDLLQLEVELAVGLELELELEAPREHLEPFAEPTL